ncbi:MAG: 16S rRNA (guanine(527)-N(7))-methyltransferase RsmG [Ekhidna sp.]
MQKDQFEKLYPLYQEWNEKINVISRKDIDQLYERHVLHSLAIAKFIEFKPGSRLLDLGTGGGFPGIPLAILFPDCQFHLVDSIGKKIQVVLEVAKGIGLENLTAEHQRAEKVKGEFDFVLSRAVAKTKQLYIWTHQKVSKENKNSMDNGLILLKGGDLKTEMKEFRRPYKQVNLRKYFREEFFETKKIIYVPVN